MGLSSRAFRAGILVLPLCLLTQADDVPKVPKQCEVSKAALLSTKDIEKVMGRTYVCGKIDGNLQTLNAIGGKDDLVKKIRALRAQADCDSIDELLKLGKALE